MTEPRPAEPRPFSAADLRARAAGKLWPPERLAYVLADAPARRSDYDLNPELERLARPSELRLAAVLVPVIDHGQSATILLTQRAEHLPAHGGQIAFPGGKVETRDRSAIEAALREAREEIGLDPALAEVIGTLDPYETGSGFRILPVVAVIDAGFELQLDETEVAAVFEVPLAFLMRPENHRRHSRNYRGIRRHYYAMPYGEHYIWGATAGMIRNLYEWLYD